MKRAITLLLVTLAGVLVAGTVLLYHHAPQDASQKVYSIGEIKRDVVQDPSHWIGRTLRVRGEVVAVSFGIGSVYALITPPPTDPGILGVDVGHVDWLNRIFHFRIDTASANGGERLFLRNHALSHVALNKPITLRVQLMTDHSLNVPLVVAQIA
jgi:hypothetical protein